MENQNLPAAFAPVDATGLDSALFGESDIPTTAAQKPEVKPGATTEKTPDESTGVKPNDGTKKDEPKVEADAPDDEEEEESEDDGSEEDDSESEEDGGDEDDSETYRLGGREFATATDAIKEAERIVGRNATLAGELRVKDTKISELQAERDEAYRLNAEWKKWADAQADGDDTAKPPNPEMDPARIAETVAKRLRAENAQDQTRATYKAEIEGILALDNYEDVKDTFFTLSDKVNPMTGKNFTPNEAYDFACNALSIENKRLSKDGKVEKPAALPAKKISRKSVKSAAARPGGAKSGTVTPAKREQSFAEEMLSVQLGNSI